MHKYSKINNQLIEANNSFWLVTKNIILIINNKNITNRNFLFVNLYFNVAK